MGVTSGCLAVTLTWGPTPLAGAVTCSVAGLQPRRSTARAWGPAPAKYLSGIKSGAQPFPGEGSGGPGPSSWLLRGAPGLRLPQGRGLMWGRVPWVTGQRWWGPSRSGERSPSPFAG